jgi:hypothetical protein
LDAALELHDAPVMPLPRTSILIALLAACAMPDEDPAIDVAFAPPPPPIYAVVFDVNAPPIGEYAVPLTVNQSVTLAVVGCTGEMRLVTNTGIEGARSTIGSLDYTAPLAGTYYLELLRSSNTATPGACTIIKNGITVANAVPMGGTRITADGLRAGENIETVRVPNGASATHMLLVENSSGANRARAVGGATSGGAFYRTVAADIGTRTLIVGPRAFAGSVLPTGGAIRLLRNDVTLAGHDLDADGVGDELEVALGTCSRLDYTVNLDGVEFDCAQAKDARDTDGDGIRDGWEIFGRRDTPPHQPLPLWGANPRHKDLFVEVDGMQTFPGEAVQMTAATARSIAAIFAGETGYDEGPLRRLLQAISLRNPDQLPGITGHFDIGVAPAAAADATIYGDWGGYNPLAPTANPDGSYTAQEAANAWSTNMVIARRGIFRYTAGFNSPSCSGSQAYDSFAANVPLCAHGFAHEFGHANNLHHEGVPADAYAPNCKPNYPSLMNYSSYSASVGFSDGLGGYPILDNTNLREAGAFDPANTFIADYLETWFQYNVDRATGSVDWNRDGVYASPTTPIRAYANSRPWGSCEGVKVNQGTLPSMVTRLDPALARLGSRLYALVSIGGPVWASWSTSTFDCLPSAPSCGTWSAPTATGLIAGGFIGTNGGIDAIQLAGIGGPYLLVVTIDANGRVFSSELRTAPDGSVSITAIEEIRGTVGVTARGAPSLATMDGVTARLVYLGTDGIIHTNLRASGAWQGDAIARRADDTALAASMLASPSITRAYLPTATTAGIYGAFADPGTGVLALYYQDPFTLKWSNTNLMESTTAVRGRPAMQWQPRSQSTEAIGILHVIYSDSEAKVWSMRSYTRLTGTGPITRVGMRAYLINTWARFLGYDMAFDGTRDANLRTVVVEPTNAVSFWPRGDGIVPGAYQNHGDWEVLGNAMCTLAASANGTAPSPVSCW